MPSKAVVGKTTVLDKNKESRAGWVIDMEKIRELKSIKHYEPEMGIRICVKLPVKFRFQSGRNTWGTHRLKKDKNGEVYHSITLNQNHTLYESNKHIWHELTHAYQAERFARKTGKDIFLFDAEYFQNGRSGRAYWNNKYEEEAREVAEANSNYKLLKEGK